MQTFSCHRSTVLVPSCAARRSFAPAAPSPPHRSSPAVRVQRRRLAAAPAAAAATDKYPAWEAIFSDLTKAGTESISPVDANDQVVIGKAVLIDVRPKDDHEQAHPQGAIHVPAFVVIESPSSPGEFAKWLACKANGVTPTKANPDLAAQVAAAAAGGKKAILACEAGGTLEPSVNFPQGKVSRSLKAIWKVVTSGALPADQVAHLQGGVYSWFSAGLPMSGEYDASNAGRTPNVAQKPSGRFIDGSE